MICLRKIALALAIYLHYSFALTNFAVPRLGQNANVQIAPENGPRRHQRLDAVSTAFKTEKKTEQISLRTYEYDGWKIAYRYKAPSKGFENADPIILIHPVGIGMSSWFWLKFMESWKGGAIYAPNLIGCGLEDGNDKWDPDEKGMAIPLGWVKAVEVLIQERRRSSSCTVVVQGASAPIGILLAARNSKNVISNLVLTSPPVWDDVATALPGSKIESNYNFYRSNWGELAFQALENSFAVRLFSNLFLFKDKCDDRWIELSCSKDATTVEARPPVMVFNSGFLQHRSYEEELTTLDQPTLVLSGSGDKRSTKRTNYGSKMKDCTLRSASGSNVLPWEVPEELCKVIQSFVQRK